MDVHRCRFVPYPTSAISAIAFSRSNDSGFSGPLPALKLAIGRANGSIEIWNPQRGLWIQETTFVGDNASVDDLAWTQDPNDTDSEGQIILGQQRLFSIASSPAVTEWNLATGEVKRRSTGNFSEVWCFAAQPRSRPQTDVEQEQDIVAGCGDGTLVLLSTADNDLQFKRLLARVSGKKARCICLAYQNRDKVVGGFADSMIRIYDTRNGSQIRAMSLGVSIPGAPKNALVWKVRCLPNGDIVSGDSNGEVKFWDGKTYSLSQRIAGHETDCLDLVTSSDGRTVISGSMDGKLAVYKLSIDGGRKTWAKTNNRRVHEGETKAMAAFDSKGMSVVVSGGSDVAPVVTPLREYGKENLRTLQSLPQDPPLASAPKARLLVSWWQKEIRIWRIAKRSVQREVYEDQAPRRLVARIDLNVKQNIRSVSISADGKLLAASTDKNVKVFQLRRRQDLDDLAIRKVEVPVDLATSGARVVQFSPDAKWLATVTPESEVHVARIIADPTRPKHLQVLEKTVELDRQRRRPVIQSGFKDYERTITRLAFGLDSSVLVAGDLSGYLDSWVLEGNEDLTAAMVDISKQDSTDGSSDVDSDSSSDSDSSDDDDSTAVFYGQHWTDNPAGHLLPKLESSALIMTFRPASTTLARQPRVNGNPAVHSTRHNPHAHSHELPHGQHRLFILTAKHQMWEFDVLAGKLSDWSRRNPTAVLPEDFKQIRDRAMGAMWDIDERKERLWLYGSTFVCMLNVGINMDENTDYTLAKTSAALKKRRKPKDYSDEDTVLRKQRKTESGAGERLQGSSREAGDDFVRRYEDGAWTEVELGRKAESEGDDDADDIDLQPTRVNTNGGLDLASDHHSSTERKWWCTFKYRPILGIVPLVDEDREDDGLEVVLVERPHWDVKNESR